MNALLNITRWGMVAVLAAAHLVMSVASVTHELSHGTENAVRSQMRSVSEIGTRDASSLHPSPGFCFFCAHGPTTLLLSGASHPSGLLIAWIRPISIIPEKPAIAPTFPAFSLRGPPCPA